MKILTVIGARPQFIKAAAFSNELKSFPKITEVIIHTGQHYNKDMSAVFFKQLNIPKPNYFLKSGGKSHGEMTGYQIIELEKIMNVERPDCLVVYGDTNSSLSAVLTASKLNIPIAHIEAGLRSYNMKMPEEINRVLIDRLSKFLFCPSDQAKLNLIKEGYKKFENEIHVVGDIMLDSIKLFNENFKTKRPIEAPYIVCTIHRQENTDSKFRLGQIIKGLNKISEFKKIIFPIHPRTKKMINYLKIELNNNIIMYDPMSYLDFLSHIKYSDLVITDSGGLQKESYFLRKNCLVIREETEWTELIEHNFNKLCGYRKEKIIQNFNDLSNLNGNFDMQFYGDGQSANKILNVISNKL